MSIASSYGRNTIRTYTIIEDPMKTISYLESDPFKFTETPSIAPSDYPSPTPSASPTIKPSIHPSEVPTMIPSVEPSMVPTSSPTMIPSEYPTVSPSFNPTTSIEPSISPTGKPTIKPSAKPSIELLSGESTRGVQGYFNYDPHDNYGPGIPELVGVNQKLTYKNNGWGQIRETPEFFRWKELQPIHNKPLGNRCLSSGNQSPIDLCPDKVNFECPEHHQIRSFVSMH